MGVSTALSDIRTCLLVKITTDSGLVGWGETIDVGGTRAVIETKHKPALLGKNPLEHRKLWRTLWGPNFGDGRAVGGVDVALHDLRGKALGRRSADLYGGRVRDKVLAYASAMNYTDGVRPEDQFPAEAAELVEAWLQGDEDLAPAASSRAVNWRWSRKFAKPSAPISGC